MYEKYIGPIPSGLVIRHKCDNRACINPDHLETGTSKDNSRDRDTRGRSRSCLTKEQILKIRNDNRILKEIGATYGISLNAVSNIKSRRRWGWVS